jgi:hypothetical protein
MWDHRTARWSVPEKVMDVCAVLCDNDLFLIS